MVNNQQEENLGRTFSCANLGLGPSGGGGGLLVRNITRDLPHRSLLSVAKWVERESHVLPADEGGGPEGERGSPPGWSATPSSGHVPWNANHALARRIVVGLRGGYGRPLFAVGVAARRPARGKRVSE